MWSCHKCGKLVFFAERKQSLGYDWHPECLRCDECGKRLNPGQHAEHKGVPYCHVPCYSVLFGPTLFGHGSQVEAHTSFGKVEKKLPPGIDKSVLESKLKVYNQYYDGKSCQLKWKERNGKLILEGVLRIYWGVNNLIHLKENEDQRHHVQIRKRNSYRETVSYDQDDSSDDDVNFIANRNEISKKYASLPGRSRKPSRQRNGDVKSEATSASSPDQVLVHTKDTENDAKPEASSSDDVDTLANESENAEVTALDSEFRVEKDEVVNDDRADDHGDEKPNVPQVLVTEGENAVTTIDQSDRPTLDAEECSATALLSPNENGDSSDADVEVSLRPKREKIDLSRVQIRKMSSSRSKNKLRRRCSINGHFYNRETKTFKPPHGSGSNVWVTSMVNTREVINLLLEKFCVENNPEEFALYIVRDNGEVRRIKDDEYPLLVRVMLGPHDDVAKVFIMNRKKTDEISNEVAQYLNFQEPELAAILRKFCEEEEREAKKIKLKYTEMRRIIKTRLSILMSTLQHSTR